MAGTLDLIVLLVAIESTMVKELACRVEGVRWSTAPTHKVGDAKMWWKCGSLHDGPEVESTQGVASQHLNRVACWRGHGTIDMALRPIRRGAQRLEGVEQEQTRVYQMAKRRRCDAAVQSSAKVDMRRIRDAIAGCSDSMQHARGQ